MSNKKSDGGSRRLTAWTRIGIAKSERGRTFRVGDCIKRRDGKKGQWRIIGMDEHRSGVVELILRGEKSGKQDRIDIEDAKFLKPPYRVVF